MGRAEADKARYLHELANYIPPPGFDAKGDAIAPALMPKLIGGRKGKPERDANAPKRNMSAYLLYQNAMRDQFKRENPGMTFGQLAKFTSHMYKNLTPEERATWEARAQQDKARYNAEIAAYRPPPGHDARGVLIEQSRPKRRNKRGPRDPAMPKRASGAYVFFTNYMRPKVNEEFPGIKFVELGKLLGERWRALAPEDKKQYEEMAAADKARFQAEMAEYTANHQAAAAEPEPQETVSADAVHSHHDHNVAAAAYYDPNIPSPALHHGQDYSQIYHHDPYGQSQYHAA